MGDFVVALSISISFILGFWVGVDWYRRKIIEEELDAQKARTE
jgi:hypothetical protein|tara:strand:+ start:775 stop:903 length:129 start_codon:yes stop_codon:yes gene_type:complete